jgi:hypothetical protein
MMATLESVNIEALFTMLKGEPGTRKSTQALSYPGPQYWISTDRKMGALHLPAKRWGLWGTNHVTFDDFSDWDKPKAKLKTFEVSCPYKTIIVDSVTSIGDNINLQTKRNKNAEDRGKTIGGIRVNSVEDYNAEAGAFQELMHILKDLHEYHRVNIILIAHVVGQRNKDNDSNKLTHHSRVIITGGDKISGKIASYMTEVYHFNIDTGFNVDSDSGQYGLYTTHTGNDYARTSLPLEGKIIFNNEPLYDKWIKPAIVKLKTEQPIQRITTTPTLTPTTPNNTFKVE